MFDQNYRKIVFIVLFTVCLSPSVFQGREYYSRANKFQNNSPSNLTTENGLNTAEFVTKEGSVRVYLPEDIAAGDTISGTVTATPAGKNEKEKKKNLAKLINNSIEIEKLKSPVSEGMFKFEISSTHIGNSVSLDLLDPKGKQLQSLAIPVFELNGGSGNFEDEGGDQTKGNGTEDSMNLEFNAPMMGQTGRPVTIQGNFDGDLSNTTCEIGKKSAKPLAESPRHTLFESPSDLVGMTEISFSEGDTSVNQDFRNISVSLSAAKLNLLRGESTDLQVRVEGLQGITEEVPLNLECTGSANMSGGNFQNLQIKPDEVQPDGSFNETRNLIGFRTGNFNVAANVQVNAGRPNLKDQIVHVERDPKDITLDGENERVWLVYVKTTDGKKISVYFKGNKPRLKFCDWIQIKQIEDDQIDRNVVRQFQPVDDPNQPCTLSNQVVHIEGNPLRMPDGRWRIKAKTQDGKTIYIRIQSPGRPDLKFCNWIKLHTCKKIGNTEFVVDGFDKTHDPKSPPPVPVVTPPPTPKPKVTPKTPPAPVETKCPEGAVKDRKSLRKHFEVLERESTISMTLSTGLSGGNEAANMAAWLRGLSKLGGLFEDDIPDGARAGAAVATAALEYLKAGADILSALGKSGLKNKRVTEVKISIYISTKKVTAECTTYEICIDGDWIPKKKYSESDKDSAVRRSYTIDVRHNDWEKIADSGTYTFNPDKFEAYAKELLKKELEKLKKNAEELEQFKEKCK